MVGTPVPEVYTVWPYKVVYVRMAGDSNTPGLVVFMERMALGRMVTVLEPTLSSGSPLWALELLRNQDVPESMAGFTEDTWKKIHAGLAIEVFIGKFVDGILAQETKSRVFLNYPKKTKAQMEAVLTKAHATGQPLPILPQSLPFPLPPTNVTPSAVQP